MPRFLTPPKGTVTSELAWRGVYFNAATDAQSPHRYRSHPVDGRDARLTTARPVSRTSWGFPPRHWSDRCGILHRGRRHAVFLGPPGRQIRTPTSHCIEPRRIRTGVDDLRPVTQRGVVHLDACRAGRVGWRLGSCLLYTSPSPR